MLKESLKPLDAAAVARIPSREARSDKLPPINQSIFVSAEQAPVVRTRVERSSVDGQFEIIVEVDGLKAGTRAFPGPIHGKGFRRGLPQIDSTQYEDLLSAFVPDHLSLAPVPTDIVKAARKTFLADSLVKRPTTIFGTDNRRVFRDTNYPWSTVGLVETPHGTGSGVMIGPRHLLTVSHVIDWNVPAPYAANWVKFTPSYYDGNEPFGHAYSTNIYWFNKDDGNNTISNLEEQFDYVVVVLGSRIGEATGWMGARGYTDSWDMLNVWSHMGYPGDLNGGQRPSFQSPFPMDGSSSEPDEHEVMLHQADVFPGQSGGPMFGWWTGDVGPRAVAVQSWQNSANNGASGGGDLDQLVISARTDFP